MKKHKAAENKARKIDAVLSWTRQRLNLDNGLWSRQRLILVHENILFSKRLC